MMSSQQAMSATKRLYDELFNKGNMNICDELMAQNLKVNDTANTKSAPGINGYKMLEKKYQAAFPDRKVKIDDMMASEDKICVRWTCQATQKGKLDDISPTNKSVKVSGISIYRFTNGKITEIWQNWDRLGLLEQLGEIQPALAIH